MMEKGDRLTHVSPVLTEQKKRVSSRLFLYLNPKCPLIGALQTFSLYRTLPPKGQASFMATTIRVASRTNLILSSLYALSTLRSP
jgi:hypothetical protein